MSSCDWLILLSIKSSRLPRVVVYSMLQEVEVFGVKSSRVPMLVLRFPGLWHAFSPSSVRHPLVVSRAQQTADAVYAASKKCPGRAGGHPFLLRLSSCMERGPNGGTPRTVVCREGNLRVKQQGSSCLSQNEYLWTLACESEGNFYPV